MHYRNGREAKNGDRVVQLTYDGKIGGFGILFNAVAGNVASVQPGGTAACLVDCLHADDVEVFLAEKGLDKRPTGK